MIKCPRGCQEIPVCIYRSPVDPARDRFRCTVCRVEWYRYDGKED